MMRKSKLINLALKFKTEFCLLALPASKGKAEVRLKAHRGHTDTTNEDSFKHL